MKLCTTRYLKHNVYICILQKNYVPIKRRRNAWIVQFCISSAWWFFVWVMSFIKLFWWIWCITCHTLCVALSNNGGGGDMWLAHFFFLIQRLLSLLAFKTKHLFQNWLKKKTHLVIYAISCILISIEGLLLRHYALLPPKLKFYRRF